MSREKSNFLKISTIYAKYFITFCARPQLRIANPPLFFYVSSSNTTLVPHRSKSSLNKYRWFGKALAKLKLFVRAKRGTKQPSPAGEGGPRQRWMRSYLAQTTPHPSAYGRRLPHSPTRRQGFKIHFNIDNHSLHSIP